MGDGSAQRHGLILCTDSYTIKEVVQLINVLIIRYRLECTLRFHTPTQPRINIRERSMSLLRTIVRPHMHSSMAYKLREDKAYHTAGKAGCFFVKTSKSKTHKLGEAVQLIFQIAQHSRDSQLINSLVKYLGCGIYKESSTQGPMAIYTVTKFTDLTLKIIPFFDRYPLPGNKALEFADFKSVVELMKNKDHLSAQGLEQIRNIKTGMNRGRQMSTWARPRLDQAKGDFKFVPQRGLHILRAIKKNIPAKKKGNFNNKLVPIKKHTPVSTLEWTNSVYMYNTKKLAILSAIDKIVIKLIKSYFNAYFLSNKIRKLSVLNKITISKLEVKHTNYKVVILVYVYSAKLINLQFLYENLSNNTKFSLVGLLGRCYNKKVELRVIRLRDMHLNASILAERLANELNKKFMSPLRALRRVLKTVRIPKLNLKLHS